MHTDLVLMPVGARWADLRAGAVAAEEAGFDGLWTWDHLRDPDGRGQPVPEAWTTLTALAGVTRRVMLGPLVLNVANRHPGLLANMAATFQDVSGGRLLLGIGAGGSRRMPYATEQVMLGQPVGRDRERAGRVAEAAQLMQRLWAGDPTDFAGEYYHLHGPAGYLRPDPAPPIIVAGFGPRMATIAGQYGDGFNAPAGQPNLAALVQTARDAHVARGRDPNGFIVTVFTGLSERWLRPTSPDRAALERLGVARLMLALPAPYDPDQIRAAGALLRDQERAGD